MSLFINRRITCKYLLCLVIPILLSQSVAFCQNNPLRKALLNLIAKSDSLNKNNPAEKIYIQFDKPYYTAGDTIWFKAWLLNGPTYLLSAKSGILHLDIADDSNRVIKEYLFPIEQGISWSSLVLNEKDFRAGVYLIRAYTNWMRNFAEDGFYYKQMQVTGTGENTWLANTHITNEKGTVKAQLQLADLDKAAVKNQPLQLLVTEGNSTLHKQKLTTDAGGWLNVQFALPQKHSNFRLVAEDSTKKHRVIIPFNLQGDQNIDLQFMPEGGNMVAGIKTHIGFKAIGADGRGMEVSGKIIDHNNNEITSFGSLHNGMGSFDLLPQRGAAYTARVTIAGRTPRNFPLPDVKSYGTVLHINNLMQNDSLTVIIESIGMAKPDGRYFLVGKSRDVICYASAIDLHDEIKAEKKIAKSLFPSGITHFILLNAQEQPLNERLIFIDHQDQLHINIASNQTAYGIKDSVALHLTVTDTSGKPIAGNFSLAVTDDAYVKIDSLNQDNILTHLLLSADLKGCVEGPAYYFQKSVAIWRDLDNLLLTQGWVGYAASAATPYKAEKEFIVDGAVHDDFNKPVKGTHVLLFSKMPSLLMDTVTDNEGHFSFRHFPRADTPIFLLKAVNKKGKSSNVSIKMDETQPPVFRAPKLPLQMPWYVNTDPVIISYVKNSIAFQKATEYQPDGKHHLKEVKIIGKKIVDGSRNLNGAGNADIILNEKDMEGAGKKSFKQLLEENIKGFHDGFFWVSSQDHKTKYPFPAYFINMKFVIILVDGVPIYNVYGFSFDDLKRYLTSHTAEDIKGIEVMTSEKWALRYKSWLAPAADLGVFEFIEITTRSGHGPAIDNVPGMYLYKPLAVSWPARFYKPKYTVKDSVHRSDFRSTIDWEPNITTNADGKATVWFYAGQIPSTYTLILEGTDFNGNLGYIRQKIVIDRRNAEAAKSK
jgi:hypothetical protein